MRWVEQNFSSKHYKFLPIQNTTVRYTDMIKTKPSRRDFIYSKSYSIFIFKLRKKPGEKNVRFTEVNPVLRSLQRLYGQCHQCALTRLSSIRMSASNSCSPTFHFCCEAILTPPPPVAATACVEGLNFCRSSSRRLSIPPAPANA